MLFTLLPVYLPYFTVYLSICYLSVLPPVYLFIWIPVSLSTCLSFSNLIIYKFLCLFSPSSLSVFFEICSHVSFLFLFWNMVTCQTVNLRTCLLIHLSTCQSIKLSTSQLVNHCFKLPVYLSIFLWITWLPVNCLSTYILVYLSTCLPIHLSTCLFICLPIYLSISMLLYTSTWLSVYLCTYLFFYLST